MAMMKPRQCDDEGDTMTATMRQQRHHNDATAMTTPQRCDDEGDITMAMMKPRPTQRRHRDSDDETVTM